MATKKTPQRKSKTHWLQSPDKNYLGHWDLPNGEPVTLTIKLAEWRKVKNPITEEIHNRRVIVFKERGYKPMICNQTNAQAIIKATGVKFMEDSKGLRVTLYVGQHIDLSSREKIDCLRIKKDPEQKTKSDLTTLRKLLEENETALENDEVKNIRRIIRNKEVLSYTKAINHIKSKL